METVVNHGDRLEIQNGSVSRFIKAVYSGELKFKGVKKDAAIEGFTEKVTFFITGLSMRNGTLVLRRVDGEETKIPLDAFDSFTITMGQVAR